MRLVTSPRQHLLCLTFFVELVDEMTGLRIDRSNFVIFLHSPSFPSIHWISIVSVMARALYLMRCCVRDEEREDEQVRILRFRGVDSGSCSSGSSQEDDDDDDEQAGVFMLGAELESSGTVDSSGDLSHFELLMRFARTVCAAR